MTRTGVIDDYFFSFSTPSSATVSFGDVHTIYAPALSGNYLIVVDGTAVIEGGSLGVATEDTFDRRKDAYKFMFSFADNALTNVVSGKTYNITATNLSADYYNAATVTVTYTVGNLSYNGKTEFQLYSLEEVTGLYQLMTFNLLENAAYYRQYITYTPMDVAKAVSETESETVYSETTPTDGTAVSGETQDSNA